MIRTHEALLALITRYGLACLNQREQAPELLAEIDKTLFDLYDTLRIDRRRRFGARRRRPTRNGSP